MIGTRTHGENGMTQSCAEATFCQMSSEAEREEKNINFTDLEMKIDRKKLNTITPGVLSFFGEEKENISAALPTEKVA